ncbi:MAG: sugar phosphate isomerase/epimerase [Rhodothermales bacterium]|jgi:sugar phosphate isomerase/epimerase
MSLSCVPGLEAQATLFGAALQRHSWFLFLALLACNLAADESYQVQTIPVPGNIVLEVSGLDYAADGTLYICTRHGDVWTVKNGDWKRFAWGLHESMGLCIGKTGRIFVSQRPEITELVDTDGDGVVNEYNTITDGFSSVPSFHQYTYGLVEDKDGNLCGTLSCTGKTNDKGLPASSSGFSSEPFRMWSYKVTPQGEFKPWSSGLRTANGIGKNLAGDLFSADNQGDWVGSSMIHHLTEGAFHGNAKALKWDKTFAHRDNPEKAPLAELDKLRKMPAVYLPHGEWMNSPGAPICDTTAGKFGPFAGQMFIGDVLHPNIMRVTMETVNGQYQGACIPFVKGGPLKAGICRLAFSPKGELVVGRVGEGNWARGAKGNGLQKIIFSGKMPFEIHSVSLMKNGFVLDFTKPVDAKTSTDAKLYKIIEYHYKYHAAYGSPKTDTKPIAVKAVELSADKKRVFLKIDNLTPRKIYEFKLPGVVDESGKSLRQNQAYYTLNELVTDKTFDAADAGASPSAAATAQAGDAAKRDLFPYVPSIYDSVKRSLDEQAALFKELGYSGCGELAQELGFAGFGHPKNVTVPERVASLDKHGLRLMLATGRINLNAAQPIDLAKVKEIMPALAKHKTILGVSIGGKPGAGADSQVVNVLNQMADLAKPHGVEIAIYPHKGDYTETTAQAVRIVSKVNRPEQVGVVFNQFHWMLAGAPDLESTLRNAGPWLKVVNVHGTPKAKPQVMPLDQGDFDHGSLLSILDDINYQGPISLFTYGISGDARAHLTASMSKWKSLTATTVKLREEGQQVDIEFGGKPFSTYTHTVEANAPAVTQFFYPLLAPNGANLAADQFLRQKKKLPVSDHPHHRGLRFSHLYKNLARDYWHETRHHHKRFSKVDGDTMVEELEWEGKSGGIEMKERREFRFLTFPDGSKGIDVTLTYEPGDTVPLTINPMNWMNQNDQIFALMVIRINPELGASRVVTAAPGKVVNTSKDGPHSKNVADWKGPWVDISGTVDGKACGIAFIAHPENTYPTVWRNNYLQWGIQASLEAKGGVTLGEGDALVSRYLAVIHNGDAAAAGLNEKAQVFRGQ